MARGFAELRTIAMPDAAGAASLVTDGQQRAISDDLHEDTALLGRSAAPETDER